MGFANGYDSGEADAKREGARRVASALSSVKAPEPISGLEGSPSYDELVSAVRQIAADQKKLTDKLLDVLRRGWMWVLVIGLMTPRLWSADTYTQEDFGRMRSGRTVLAVQKDTNCYATVNIDTYPDVLPNTVSNNFVIAIGNDLEVGTRPPSNKAAYSVAIGRASQALNQHSYSFGAYNTVSNAASATGSAVATAIGYGNINTNVYSTVIGMSSDRRAENAKKGKSHGDGTFNIVAIAPKDNGVSRGLSAVYINDDSLQSLVEAAVPNDTSVPVTDTLEGAITADYAELTVALGSTVTLLPNESLANVDEVDLLSASSDCRNYTVWLPDEPNVRQGLPITVASGIPTNTVTVQTGETVIYKLPAEIEVVQPYAGLVKINTTVYDTGRDFSPVITNCFIEYDVFDNKFTCTNQNSFVGENLQGGTKLEISYPTEVIISGFHMWRTVTVYELSQPRYAGVLYYQHLRYTNEVSVAGNPVYFGDEDSVDIEVKYTTVNGTGVFTNRVYSSGTHE